jgi:HlyD family secretion protein
MKEKKELIINFVKKYYKKKRFWAIIIIVIIFLFFFLKPAKPVVNISIDTAKYVDLKQTVLATGQVTSNTDLNLSFNSTGIVKSLKVKVGDVVKKGDVLATIDQSTALASLTQARGALLSAQAKYKKLIEGGDVALAQVVLDQTKKTQDTIVKNAYKKLLNSTPEAFPDNGTDNYEAPIISGTYNGDKEGVINVNIYRTSGGIGFNLSGLVSGSGLGNNITPQPLGNSGLYIRFPSTNDFVNWVIQIPNKKAPDYLSNYNAYQSAVSQAESSIEQATKDLELKKTRSQGSDTDLARAEIISAEGQVQSAQAKFEDTILRAPADGTITSVDLKLGELSEAQKPIITLQDVSNLYVEAKINESNIANVKLGQSVTMTFDAFGTSRIFNGTVVHIDPGATTTDGIVNYKIKASILNLDQAIRTGMNADISILTAEKDHALVIPKAAVISRDDKTYVNVITKKDSQEYKEKEIKTGLTGDGNRIEITNGLSDGEEIAIVSK